MFTRLLNTFTAHLSKVSPVTRRYKDFRFTLLFVITIIALIPSTLLAVLGYFRFLDLAEGQSRTIISYHLNQAKGSFQHYLANVSDLTTTAATSIQHAQSSANEQLKILLDTLKKRENSLTGISLLDQQNVVIAAAGQQLPSSIPLSDDLSWVEAEENGSFLKIDAYHNHTVLLSSAPLLRNGSDAEIRCILYFDGLTTLQLKQRFIDQSVDDLFLMDSSGMLLSNSNYYGRPGNFFPHFLPTDNARFTSITTGWGLGLLSIATSPVSGSPWHLVLLKEGPGEEKEWMIFQLSLVLIFLACAAGSFVIIHQLVNLLIIRIRAEDTKRMALLNEVGHTNRLATIGKLAAGVAHEINNPLAVIDQRAGLIDDILELMDDFDNKQKILESIDGIHKSIDRCKVITHRLLGFARKMDGLFEELDINDLLKEVLGFLEKEALYSHILFHLNLQEDLPLIHSDRGQLQQIFLNIISNSIDAIDRDGNITITSSLAPKDRILIRIDDDGPGIKPKVMEHIFDPFFTTKKTGEGTGLGLSITYGLVNKLGGTIKVHSTVGGGANFFIYLPTTNRRKEGDANGKDQGTHR